MKTLPVTEVARNFSAGLDTSEREQEEIVLIRTHRQVGRLVPHGSAQNAPEVLGDLYRTLDQKTAAALTRSIGRAKKPGTLSELRNPWACTRRLFAPAANDSTLHVCTA